MAKNLVIVESPAKAKTIEGFLGKDFMVKSCFGHVRDLPKNSLGIEIKKGFTPKYEVSGDKKKVIADLKKEAKEVEMVWLASDEDREGEAISWHLVEALGLDEKNTKRIVFHEITKPAIVHAIENPRNIDKHLVDAQQARRVLDRLVGYELSPLLWKKVRPALSAGRVQSVAVRLIVERENEIRNFVPVSAYRVSAVFLINKTKEKAQLQAELSKKFDTREEALAFLEKAKSASFSIGDIETKPARKSPAPPFTTSTLQQEASRKLGFSVAKTMLVAQQLYESGKITYMRTDSVNLSDMALHFAKDEIARVFGPEYVKIRKYSTKTKGAQEAHEAIRPTYLDQQFVKGDASQQKLYELIWKRTIASQMSDALLEKTNVTIDISNAREKFIARGEVIKFDGFLKVYKESTDDEDTESKEGTLPPMNVGETLDLREMTATQKFTLFPPRYTEASLVKKLEELGIGRPSTYAPIISTILRREYVLKEDKEGFVRNYQLLTLKNNNITEEVKRENVGFEKSKLFPTDIGTLVNNFLMEYFANILDYNFTASVEKEFDEIAQGQKAWNEMISQFYSPFHKQIENTTTVSQKVSGEKLLGTDPATGKNVYVKIGKFGPIVQIGNNDNDEKPRFAGLLKHQSLETITLEEALDLFTFPRDLGKYEGSDIQVGTGRFGPYVKHRSSYYSLKKSDNPLTITLDRAIDLILEKRTKETKKLIREFEENKEVKILNGRWGPYISANKSNYKIPKSTDPATLTLADCLRIISESASGSQAKHTKTTRKK